MESDLSLWYIQADIFRESVGFLGLKHGSETWAGDLDWSHGV